MAADPNGGYWTVNWLGAVAAYGGAPTFGSPALSGIHLSKPIVGIESTPDGLGYWLVASDGGIFTYGDAPFYGSTGSIHLNDPIVGMAPTPDGLGYWLVASDGGIFTYGDAPFYGSTGSIHLNDPIVGMAPTPDGLGYWLVASDGGIFTYGDAPFYGSTGSIHLNDPIVGMAPTPDGLGYWLVASDGGIFTYGDAPFYGSLGEGGSNVLGIIVNLPNFGYSLVQLDGTRTAFSSPVGSTSSESLTAGSRYTTEPTVTTVTPNTASMADDCQPAATPTATVDSSLTDLVSNETGPGWIGGDATYSTELPNGGEAFVFSDTLIGTAQASGAASLTGFIHNSELVGSLPYLSTDLSGTFSAPQTLIPDTTDSGDQWQVAATYMENGQQLVFVNEFAPGNPFDKYTGVSGIAVLSIPVDGMPTLSSITPVPTDSYTQWGNAVMQSNGYDYIYGNYGANGMFLAMKVARAPLGESLDTANWQYWNGSGWVSGEGNAAPVSTFNQLTGVTPEPDGLGYIAVSTTPSVYAASVDLSYSCSPQGPWTSPTPVYSVPQIAEYTDEIAYIPTFHPELSSAGGLIVSYNIDTTSGLADLERNVHQYQPQFLQLNLSAP